MNMRYFGLMIVMLFASTISAMTYEVSGGGDKLQAAIDNIVDGDSIVIIDTLEYGQTTIESKKFNSGVVITSKAYLDKGTKRFASNMPVIIYQDKENTRPHTDEEAVDSEISDEYSRNGAFRVIKSSNIIIEGIIIDGGGVWQRYYAVWSVQLFGNNAVTLYNAGNITIRGCKIRNAYRGIYQKDRNTAGVFTSPNPDDVDLDEFAPAANPLTMGNHIIEQNMIYDNHWGLMFDILWDAASTYRNNLIFNNGLKDKDYVIAEEVDGVERIDWTIWLGGAAKVNGVFYVPLLFEHNTFYKNISLFNSHWGTNTPNIRMYNNLFARSDDTYYDDQDVFQAEGSRYDKMYETIFKTVSVLEKYYLGLEGFSNNTIAKQWNGDGDFGYVAMAQFDGKTEPTGGEVLDLYHYAGLEVKGTDNIYLGKTSAETFKNFTNSDSEDFLVALPITEIKDRGVKSKGYYDTDMSKADIGAIDNSGKWAGTASPVEMYDRDKYAIVEFTEDDGDPTSVVNINFRMKYEGKAIEKIEYVHEKYNADISKSGSAPETYDLGFISSDINEMDTKEKLSSGQLVEVNYIAYSPEFNTTTSSSFARYMLQVKVTDVDGNEYYSNVGYFDYQKMDFQFKVSLFEYNDGAKGDQWNYGENVGIYEPFWMSILTINEDGEEIGMEQYNGSNTVIVKAESSLLWEDLWRWNSDDKVDIAAQPGIDDRWVKMDVNNDSSYLGTGWSDGTWEGVFTFSKPSAGDAYLRVNLQGSESYNSSIAGTSTGFTIISTPDSIQFVSGVTYEATDVTGLISNSTTTYLELVVKDIEGNLLVNQEVTIEIDATIGSLLNYLDEEVSKLVVITGLDGVAKITVTSTSLVGATGNLTASVLADGGDIINKVIVAAVVTDKAVAVLDETSYRANELCNFKVAPNPIRKGGRSYVFFNIEEEKEVTLSICNTNGNEILSYTPAVEQGENMVELPTESLDKGDYIMFLKYNDEVEGPYFFVVRD